MFEKVLIANRGEIACRIAAVCKEMGIATVAVFSDADTDAPHVVAADEAVHIGPPRATESYLDAAKILDAAKRTGADAIHPGYGFLSERATFARACTEAGIAFIGPAPETIEKMGDKAEAIAMARKAGVPVVPGSDGIVAGEEALKAAERIGYPVLCKAAAGGGGIGMMVAHDEKELEKALATCESRAQAAFGDGAVYLERYFERPRHVEIQILSDAHGHHLHLFERECSIQRRHQKVVEEGPSPLAYTEHGPALLARMYAAAVRLADSVDYLGAGTVECLVDGDDFYFIEMNTRLQVEHPCTELTTGVDLIGWQLRIAAGERLDLRQEDVSRSGHVIEMRIYAEDPAKKFFPSPGKLERFEPPTGEGIRVDAGVRTGYTVTPFYDPMIAKLIVTGADRSQAIDRSLAALEGFVIEGVKTNIPAHQAILRHEAFVRGELSTRFIEDHLSFG
jgi:acetyl-CoA carboxylase, biotin carboxylase subunit